MNKKQAIKALKEHGIKLKFVTPLPFYFHQQDLARKMYGIPNDCVIPTKEQYEKIISIIGQDGLYAIMEEYITHDCLRLLSSFEDPAAAWNLTFNSEFSSQASWNSITKAFGFSVALWKLPENF